MPNKPWVGELEQGVEVAKALCIAGKSDVRLLDAGANPVVIHTQDYCEVVGVAPNEGNLYFNVEVVDGNDYTLYLSKENHLRAQRKGEEGELHTMGIQTIPVSVLRKVAKKALELMNIGVRFSASAGTAALRQQFGLPELD